MTNDQWWAERATEIRSAAEQRDLAAFSRIADQMLVELGKGGYDVQVASRAVSRLVVMQSIAASAGLERTAEFFERDVRPILPDMRDPGLDAYKPPRPSSI